LPVIGMIVPPLAGGVPPEARELYGDAFTFLAAGVGVGAFRRENYIEALTRVPAAVDRLVAGGASALGVMGTSLTFALGRAYDDRLQTELRERTGLPVTTMASAIVDALHGFGARRIAVAAAYDATVTEQLVGFLREHGFDVANSASLGIVDGRDLAALTTGDIVGLARRAVPDRNGVDALVISCGGLRTIAATRVLEAELLLPVVSSAIAGPWGTVRLLGHSGAAAGGGALTGHSLPVRTLE
jgi:arylmalonate decarboxylase